jgi:histidinol-phosphate aminotransferase
VQKVPLRNDGAHDLRAMVAAAHARPTGLLYVCNPNNPTGSISPPDELAWLLAHKPASTRVLVDEAYLQYSEQPSLIAQVAQRDDLIVLRTFSKLYGMAGLRLGVAAAHPERLRELASPGDNPLPVPRWRRLASLQDPQLIPQRRLQNAKVRQATIAWLGKRGFSCLPSEANCFVVDVQRDGSTFAKAMADNGVVIGRSWPIWPQRARDRRQRGRDGRVPPRVCQGGRRTGVDPIHAWRGSTVVGADRWSGGCRPLVGTPWRSPARVLVSGGAWCWRS